MRKEIQIRSPLSGTAVKLEEVPDNVFAQKMMGDGAAILPEEGELYSPIDGEIVMIHDSLHAYGIRSEDGIEMLIHFGLETVYLKGEGFEAMVKAGDKVKAGDLLAKIDLLSLHAKNINTITPVIIASGAVSGSLSCTYGPVKLGDVLMTCMAEQEAEAEVCEPEPAVQETVSETPVQEQKKKKSVINFDFLQKLVKSLMTVIAVMPAAGLAISIGSVIMMLGSGGIVDQIGEVISELGWTLINNLNILFAVAIGGSWAALK